MRKYKVLLADDEREIFSRIEQFISKTEDFEIVGSVGNGFDAFHMIEKTQPDILITDIVMPFINGIELVKMVRENYPLIKPVVISGANNFEYTKEAIDLDVIGYLKKPVIEEELNNLLNKLREIYKKEALEFMINDMRVKYETSMESALENILAVNMLGGALKTSKEELKNLDFSFTDKKFSVVFVSPYKPIVNKKNFEENYYLIKHIATEIIKKSFEVNTVHFEDGIAFLVTHEDGNYLNRLSQSFFEVISSVEMKLSTELLVCISNVYDNLNDLHDAFQETQNVMYSEQLVDSGKLIMASDIIEREAKNTYLMETDINQIRKTLRKGSIEELKSLFEDLENKLFHDGFFVNHDYLCINLSNLLIEYSRDCNVKVSNVVSGKVINEFLEHKNSTSLFKHFVKLIEEIRVHNKKSKVDKSERILNNAIKYIEANYDDPSLSLEMVGNEINISVSHLSMLFKKKIGINFIKYLINYRMEMAKKLFRETDLKVVNIASMCGYNNVYYFSHSFKKYTGISPGKYRNHEV